MVDTPHRVDAPKASLSGSVIDIVIKTGNLRTILVEWHGHDTYLFSLLILLMVHVNKFNVHDTPITFPLKLAQAQPAHICLQRRLQMEVALVP